MEEGSILAKAGYTKESLQKYLFDHARITARDFKGGLEDYSKVKGETLCDVVNGLVMKSPKFLCESTDPNRMLPVMCDPDDFIIA